MKFLLLVLKPNRAHFVFNSLLLIGRKIDFVSSNICLRVINFHSSVSTRFLLKNEFPMEQYFSLSSLRKWIYVSLLFVFTNGYVTGTQKCLTKRVGVCLHFINCIISSYNLCWFNAYAHIVCSTIIIYIVFCSHFVLCSVAVLQDDDGVKG
jgi:hypothetical protein